MSSDIAVILPKTSENLPKTSRALIVWEDCQIVPEKPQTLRCGLSAGCDLNFSSLQKNGLIACLQRPVSALNGAPILPQELRVRASLDDAYPVLAAAALSFLCGGASGEKALN